MLNEHARPLVERAGGVLREVLTQKAFPSFMASPLTYGGVSVC